jgi:hypothetical protein
LPPPTRSIPPAGRRSNPLPPSGDGPDPSPGDTNDSPGENGNADIASAWAARATELADWAWTHLVNRTHCWGGYRPREEWDREYTRPDGTKGKLGPQTTRKGRLTEAVLARHFLGRRREHVVGLHSTSQENTSRWGALDIDWHGPTSTAPEVNLRATLAWYDRLVSAGFHPLLTDSNGSGGFHLLVLLARPVTTARVHHFLRLLVADHARYGMTALPETFPKQALLRPRPDGTPGYGNWLRLPGRHHTREHWSRVWSGSRWLNGHEAIDHILSLTGDSPDLVPAPPPEPPPPPRRAACAPAARDNLSARIAAYLSRLPNLGEGQGRDDVAYQFAAFLVRDLGLPDETALAWLERWDARNSPPKGSAQLAEIMSNARHYGKSPFGCGLQPAPMRHNRSRHSVLSFHVEVG